jgi:signal transduction histidine kinase
MSDSTIRQGAAQAGAIEEELTTLLRLIARPLDEGAITEHLQEIAQHIVDGLRRLLGVAGCQLHAAEAFAGSGLRRLAASPATETTTEPPGDAVARALRERRVVSAPDGALVLAVPLVGGDRPVGVLEVRRAHGLWTREDMRLVQLFAGQATVALENARLVTEGRHRRRTVDALAPTQADEVVRVRERERIANELHDTLGQLAFSVGLKLDWCLHRTDATSPVYPRLEEIRHDTGLMMAQIRQLIGHLSPEGSGETTFADRLERLVGDFRELTGTSVDLSLQGDPTRLTAAAGDVIQKTLQEALVNIAKHARAGHATVRIEIGEPRTSIEVSDDGVGLSAAGTEVTGALPGHFGLRQMRERIEGVGGRLDVIGQPGTGVTIRGTLPARLDGA